MLFCKQTADLSACQNVLAEMVGVSTPKLLPTYLCFINSFIRTGNLRNTEATFKARKPKSYYKNLIEFPLPHNN